MSRELVHAICGIDMSKAPCDPACEEEYCGPCAARECPHGEELHRHHDGCPACYFYPEAGRSVLVFLDWLFALRHPLRCQVCKGDAIGVASSALGPVSFAYCRECAELGAEPYDIAVAYVAACCGRTEAAVADWFKVVIEATAKRASKTVVEFWSDVAKEPVTP